MKLIYKGTHDEVVVPLPLGGEATVKRGKPFSTSDKHAESLLMQPSNWEAVAPKKPKQQQTPNLADNIEE